MSLARYFLSLNATAAVMSFVLAVGCLGLAAEEPTAEALPALESLWDFSDVPATEERFRALLPRAEALGEIDYLAQLLSQLARAEGLQGRFDAAHATLDRAERLLGKTPSEARMRVLLERGRAFRSAKQPEKAQPLFEFAWDLARAAGQDGHAADAGHMLAITVTGEAAIAWSEKTIAFAAASKDAAARRWLGPLRFNLGWTYHDRGDYEKALALFQADVLFREERKAADEGRISRWAVARTLRSLGRLDEALAQQHELAKLPEPDGYVFEEIGECLAAQGKSEEARPRFAKAHALLAPKTEAEGLAPARIARLKRLGGLDPAPPACR